MQEKMEKWVWPIVLSLTNNYILLFPSKSPSVFANLKQIPSGPKIQGSAMSAIRNLGILGGIKS